MRYTKRTLLAAGAVAVGATFGGAAPAEAKCAPVHGVNPCIVMSVVCKAGTVVEDEAGPILAPYGVRPPATSCAV